MLSIITVMAWLENRLRRDDKGEVAVEYVMVAGLAALAIIAGMTGFGATILGWFGEIASTVTGAI